MSYGFDLQADTYNAFGAVSLKTRLWNGREVTIPHEHSTKVQNHVSQGDKVSSVRDQYGQTYVYDNPRYQQVQEGSLEFFNKMANPVTAPLMSQACTYVQGIGGSLHTIKNFTGQDSVVNNPRHEVELQSWQHKTEPIQDFVYQNLDYLNNVSNKISDYMHERVRTKQHNDPLPVYTKEPPSIQGIPGIFPNVENDVTSKSTNAYEPIRQAQASSNEPRKEIWQGMTIAELRVWAVNEKGMPKGFLSKNENLEEDVSMIALYVGDKDFIKIANNIFNESETNQRLTTLAESITENPMLKREREQQERQQQEQQVANLEQQNAPVRKMTM